MAKRLLAPVSRRIAVLRESGWTISAIALVYGCCEATVVRHCRKHGAEPPGGSRRPGPLELEMARRARAERAPWAAGASGRGRCGRPSGPLG